MLGAARGRSPACSVAPGYARPTPVLLLGAAASALLYNGTNSIFASRLLSKQIQGNVDRELAVAKELVASGRK